MSKVLSSRIDWPTSLLGLFVMLGWIAGCSSNSEVAQAPPPEALPIADSSATDDGAMQDDSGGEMTSDESESSDSDSSGSEDTDDGSLETSDEPIMEDTNANPAPMADNSVPDEAPDDAVQNTTQQPTPEPEKPKTLLEQSQIAFTEGLELKAIRLLQAHLLSNPSQASDILASYRWSVANRQPQFIARIAAGVDLKNPHASKTKDNYKPLGSVRIRNSERSGDGDRDSEDTFSQASGNSRVTLLPTTDRHRVLQKYAGLLGDALVDHIRDGHTEGRWAPYFQSNAGVAATVAATTAQAPVIEEVTYDETSDEESSPPPRPTPPPSTASANKSEGIESKYISLGPAVSFIGVNESTELLKRARDGKFDALVIYDVEISLNYKLRLIYNDCKARLVNLADGKTIAVTKSLRNTDAQRELDKQGMAYLEKIVQPLLAALDEKSSLIEIPAAITADLIKTKRLPVLLSDTSRPKLDVLSELALYRERAWLSDTDFQAAAKSLIGADDGVKLLTGTDEERRAVVDKLLAVVP